MKVFISWSGEKSNVIAEALRDWLPTIIQTLEPFLSTQDIPPGGRGLNVMATQLQECSFGILCLTQENREKPWVNFEAGALSKVIEQSNVVPLLIDMRPNDLTGPLTQFQAIRASDKDEVYDLVQSLASSSGPPRISEHILRRTFNTFWPEFESKFAEARRIGQVVSGESIRGERDILEEILTLTRRADRELNRLMLPSTNPPRSHANPAYSPDVVLETMIEALHEKEINEVKGGVIGSQLDIEVTASETQREWIRDIFQKAAELSGLAIRVRGVPVDELFDGRKPLV